MIRSRLGRNLRRCYYSGLFLLYLGKEVVARTSEISLDMLTPGLRIDPAIVEVPLHWHSDLETALFASAITITPGTVMVGASAADETNPRTLFVHGMYARSRESMLEGIRDMERRLLRATRGEANPR